VSAGTLARNRWYCCIIGVSASAMGFQAWNQGGLFASL